MTYIQSIITRHAKKNETMAHNKKNQSIEKDSAMAQVIESVQKHTKVAVINIFYTFKKHVKKVEERYNMLRPFLLRRYKKRPKLNI